MSPTHTPISAADFAQQNALLNKLIASVESLTARLNTSASTSTPAVVPPTKPQSRLIQGDCVEIMRTLPAASVDLVVTDPPYLVNYQSRDGRKVPNDDNDRWLNPAFAEMYRVLKNNSFCISFYGWHKVDRFMTAWRQAGFQPVGHFVFVKSYASSRSFTGAHHEAAYLLAKGQPPKPARALGDVVPWKYTGNKLHPTQKPLEALAPLISAYSKQGDVVLDPFGGSGSTAVAARQQGRQFISIEQDPKYYAIAKKRLAHV